MASVAPGGTAERIAARILFKVPRAGSGTRARYSSTLFAAPLLFAAELRSADFAFFMREMLQEARNRVHAREMGKSTRSRPSTHNFLLAPNVRLDYGCDVDWFAFGVSLRITNSCKMFAALPAAIVIAAFSNVSPTPR